MQHVNPDFTGIVHCWIFKEKKPCSIDRTSWNWIENWFVHLRCGRKHFCYKGLSVFRGKWYKTAFILLFKISTWIILLYCFHTQLTEFGAWSLWLFKKFLSFSPHCHFFVILSLLRKTRIKEFKLCSVYLPHVYSCRWRQEWSGTDQNNHNETLWLCLWWQLDLTLIWINYVVFLEYCSVPNYSH